MFKYNPFYLVVVPLEIVYDIPSKSKSQKNVRNKYKCRVIHKLPYFIEKPLKSIYAIFSKNIESTDDNMEPFLR